MDSRQEKLANFVRAKLEKEGWSYRDVAMRSRGAISHGAVSDVINCRSRDINLRTLEGLAKGLGVQMSELLIAMDIQPETDEKKLGSSDFAALYYEYSDLPDEDRREISPIKDAVFEVFRAEIRRRKALESAKPLGDKS